MNGIIDEIRRLAAEKAPSAVERRRHLHQYPELSFQEMKTAAWIREQLDRLGIPCTHGYGNNGIRAVIGRGEGPTVALRADFDALPIHEQNDVPFKSTVPGVMHACGHDAHTAMLITALEILAELDGWKGSVIGIFQPAEEKTPGGAQTMIEGGVLENPRPAHILGQHINPGLRAGTVGFRPGMMMASADEITILVKGRGGHAASPHLTIDPIVVSAQIIMGLQQVVSRSADPQTPSVLSFGRIFGDGAMNVIPDEVVMYGTFRTIDEEWRAEALHRIETLAMQTALAMGAQCTVTIDPGYPVVSNDEELTLRCRSAAEAYAGKDSVVDLPLVMWAEDFAYYGREVPGCFYNLGVSNPSRGWTSSLHSATLMIDESALEFGAGLMAWLAYGDLVGETTEVRV